MICRSCLRRAAGIRSPSRLFSSFASQRTAQSISTEPTESTPTLSTPLTSPSDASKSKAKTTTLPTSIAPAGTVLKGLNYVKGKEDPVALAEEEYPEWLWKILDAGKKGSEEGGKDDVGDEFSKSKKQRRMAAKRQRKLEAQLLASGDTEALAPKVPLQQQTIDLPANAEGTLEGAIQAVEKREEVRKAMRSERRAKIKERNFLKGM